MRLDLQKAHKDHFNLLFTIQAIAAAWDLDQSLPPSCDDTNILS